MKKYLIAASIAIAATTASFGAAHAQAVIITDGDGPGYHHRHHFDDEGQGWHRGWDRRHMQRAHCMTRMETIRRHGHTVTRETRVCN